MTKPVRKVAVIGTGAIGASWTALFLSRGLDVVATDIARPVAEPPAVTTMPRCPSAARATSWPSLCEADASIMGLRWRTPHG